MLAGPTAASTLRWPEVSGVEELLAPEVRDPVEELLLRAVRWVGRATAAESPEGSGSVLGDRARVPNAAWNGPPHQEGTRVPQPT